mgnify:FL=1
MNPCVLATININERGINEGVNINNPTAKQPSNDLRYKIRYVNFGIPLKRFYLVNMLAANDKIKITKNLKNKISIKAIPIY